MHSAPIGACHRGELVDAILVGSYPEIVVLVKHHARYTVVADEIKLA